MTVSPNSKHPITESLSFKADLILHDIEQAMGAIGVLMRELADRVQAGQRNRQWDLAMAQPKDGYCVHGRRDDPDPISRERCASPRGTRTDIF